MESEVGTKGQEALIGMRDRLAELNEDGVGLSAFTSKIMEAAQETKYLKEELMLDESIQKTVELADSFDDMKKKIKALREDAIVGLLAGFEDVGVAIFEGENAMLAFGRAAVLAISSVLSGLGAELAAYSGESPGYAVLPSIIGAAVRTALAGSAAAYTAAGVVKALAGSFQEGGVIPGNSLSGDNMIAKVNSAEVVSTKEDYATVAQILQEYRAGATGGNTQIMIMLDGNVIAASPVALVNNGVYTIEARGIK